MECIATKKGFYNDRRIAVGEKFRFSGDKPPSWATAAGEYKPEPEKSAEEQVADAIEGRQGKKVAKKKVAKKKTASA